MRLLRFWFSFEDPVDPRTYFRHGVGLRAAAGCTARRSSWALPFCLGW